MRAEFVEAERVGDGDPCDESDASGSDSGPRQRRSRKSDGRGRKRPSGSLKPGNGLFASVLGQEILLVMQADQLNMLGQTFRPIFCGSVVEVTDGYLTLDPVIIKMPNAPFHRHPTPLSFPLERIDNFTPFDCRIRFPIH